MPTNNNRAHTRGGYNAIGFSPPPLSPSSLARYKGDFRSELCSDGEAMRIDPEGKPYLVARSSKIDRKFVFLLVVREVTNSEGLVHDACYEYRCKFTPCILFELPSLVGRNIYVPD